MRAACIRMLREQLGERFFGGFARSAHACLHPVCVATTGLWESIGWKFGEYVAFSRAIVSERLNFELPGPIAPGEHYLEFTTLAGCLAAVERLLRDDDLRLAMMRNNWRYYAEHGTPGAIVARVLYAALQRAGSRASLARPSAGQSAA